MRFKHIAVKWKVTINKNIIIGVLILFVLAGCLPEKSSVENFLSIISSVLKQGGEKAPFKKVTNFEWDQVCLFQNDDSERYATYDEYVAFLRSTYKNTDEIKRNTYTNIILFSYKGDIIQTYGLINPRIKIGKENYMLSAKELYPRADETMICEKQESLFIEISKKDRQIYITRSQGE